MIQQFEHPLLPRSNHDERSRQEFVYTLSRFVMNRVTPATKDVYERRVRKSFIKEHGREPGTRHEIRRAMEGQEEYQLAGALQRNSQEMMWDAVLDSVERESPRLREEAKRLTQQRATLGSLRLNPEMPLPAYLRENHAHCMPGGFCLDLGDGDVSAGATYDRGSFLYGGGMKGPLQDGIGKAALKFLRERHPDFIPAKIIDLGCGIASSLVPFRDAFPNAEAFGVDAGAGLLRYGHARAEALGKEMHLSQQNIEHTDFAAESFDLVLCLAVFHETSASALPNIISEAHRILKKGGILLCVEQPQYEGISPWDQFVRDWDTYNNNEPFWGAMHDIDLSRSLEEGGFDKSAVWEAFGDGAAAANNVQSHAMVDPSKIMGSDRGAGKFFFFGATK